MRGHHWLIEENTIRWTNALGMDIGRSETDMETPAIAGYHIVRRNRVSDCGVCGIAGTGPLRGTLIEENFVTRCGWHDVESYFECAGIKTHHNQSTLIRRNLLTDMTHAAGIWMDYGNINSRCSQNVIINTDSIFGGIFLEASQAPNMADNNFVWGSTRHGIYQHDCDDLLIAHNFIGKAAETGIRMNVNKGRVVLDRPATSKRNRILSNLIWDCGQPVAIADPENVSDANVFASSEKPFDLAAWQAKTGWDRNTTTAILQASFDPKTLVFSLRSSAPFARCPRLTGIAVDLLGNAFDGDRVLPGPFAKEPFGPVKLLPFFKN
jgi:alpha-N-arabinofuranosidase